MLGVNDRASLKYGEGRAQPGSAEWKEAYGKEAERLIRKLRGANIAVYWVGLPIMANAAFSETVAAMNDAARQAAYINGAKFIETWAGFTDQPGAYNAFGPDLTGQTKRLRDGDGVGLTPAGNRKLANYIEVVLRRDLAQAKAQRNIPLAGDEEEQTRVVPGVARAASAKGAAAPEWPASARRPASRRSFEKGAGRRGRSGLQDRNRGDARHRSGPAKARRRRIRRRWLPRRGIRAGRYFRRANFHRGDLACRRLLHARNPKADPACRPRLLQGFEQRRSAAAQGGPRGRLPLAARSQRTIAFSRQSKGQRQSYRLGAYAGQAYA